MRIKNIITQKHTCIKNFGHTSVHPEQMVQYWLQNITNCKKSKSENRAWKVLEHYGFVRQFFIGRRHFDFFHLPSGICIEIDGPEHCNYCDSLRDRYFLQNFKIQTFRVIPEKAQVNHLLSPITSNLTSLEGYNLNKVFRCSYECFNLYKTKEKKGKKRKQKENTSKKRGAQEKKKKTSKRVILRKKQNNFLEMRQELDDGFYRNMAK